MKFRFIKEFFHLTGGDVPIAHFLIDWSIADCQDVPAELKPMRIYSIT